MNLEEAIHLGLSRHQAGNLVEAEKVYRGILQQFPDQPDVLHLLGILAQQVGRCEAAVELIGKAITAAPGRGEFHGSLGLVLAELGRTGEAIAADRKAIELNPDLAQAHNNLGNALAQAQDIAGAMESFKRAAQLAPQAADPPYNMANLLRLLGRTDEAIAAYKHALELRPNWPQAHNNLGTVLRDRGALGQAVECFRQAIANAPEYAEAMSNLTDTLCQLARYDLAVPICKRALELKPAMPEAHNNLGNALCGLGQYDQGIIAYRQALALRPEFVEAHSNLGNAYYCKGDLEQALCLYQTATALAPEDASARWNTGLIHLMRGDYERGWPEYEWRLKLKGAPRAYAAPRWDGGDISGKTILLHVEQALGDTIQFFRYVPMLAQREGTVVLAVQGELVRLLSRQGGVKKCVDINSDSLPHFDVHLPIGSLPGVFGTTMSTIPAAVPYISAGVTAVKKWRARLNKAAGKRRKVGVVWAGRSYPDPFRAAPADLFSALGAVEENWFCSLQKGEGSAQKPPGLELTDWTDELTDFAETAALMANLDLIITVDTSVAHLAGAMGLNAWVLLKNVPDWRWMQSGSACAWYPTMRLFRQPRRGDWATPVGQVLSALKEL